MDAGMLTEYNKSRSFAGKAIESLCYAPHTNLFFDQMGRVRVCCWNSKFPVGNALTESIDDIWAGARLRILRDAVESMAFGRGCDVCVRQMEAGWTTNPPMRTFDRFAVASAIPQWPQRMEFSLSNACNLECVMCHGGCSSAIRKNRDKAPAQPRLYTTAFVRSLRKYLPHLVRAKFLGGEPFLISQYYQMWAMMIEDGLRTHCHVTTNGTIYNRRVEHALDSLTFHLAVSLDGVTKKTIESIRVNANYDQQMANLQRFRQYTKEKRTALSLTFCFMQQNWFEFGDFCLFADSLGCDVGVNNVETPNFTLSELPADRLREIRVSMERQSVELESRLTLNRRVWLAELDRVRRRHLQAERVGRGGSP